MLLQEFKQRLRGLTERVEESSQFLLNPQDVLLRGFDLLKAGGDVSFLFF